MTWLFSSFQKISETGHVEELTDISKYTGSSKERFDEHGKGKGKAGRETIVESTGYVQGSKIKETHDQKKKWTGTVSLNWKLCLKAVFITITSSHYKRNPNNRMRDILNICLEYHSL